MLKSPAPPERYDAHVLERLQRALEGRYAIEGEIGRGGMGMVFRARDLHLPRQVAIKVLPPWLASAVATERFVLEIETAAKLLHPHILGVIASGDADGLPYYIMPHVEGESLRDRLTREPRLPLAEAGRIVREVASALTCAHEHDIVHRDIKPENILLVDGRDVIVADFGLARALLKSTAGKLTRTGNIVGTATYMSPEQATPGVEPDGRADIYSLGCTLFEMLAGRPPFRADSELAVLAQHLSFPPPRLSNDELKVPEQVERVVHRALAKAPDERYQTATDFSQALDDAIAEVRQGRKVRRRMVVTGAAVAAAVAFVALAAASPWAAQARARVAAMLDAPLDTARYAIFPLRRAPNVPRELAADDLLHEAFARWSGIGVVEPLQVGDALRRLNAATPDVGALRDVARGLGAGRFVHGSVTRSADSLRIAADLYDTRSGARLDSVRVRTSGARLDARAFDQAADSLLFAGTSSSSPLESVARTSSVGARRAYDRGRRALRRWDADAADSAFAEAVAHDANLAAAQLGLAQLRGWASDDQRRWRAPAERAAALQEQLSGHDQVRAQALLHMARSEYPQACARYETLQRADPSDFFAAFGLGECVIRDSIVVPDGTSGSGWRFRGSRHRATLAYREAFALLPPGNRAFQQRAFDRIRGRLLTAANARVIGHPEGRTTPRFQAAPSWDVDTLLLVPWPDEVIQREPQRVVSTTVERAVEQQRKLLHEIAAEWHRDFPADAAPLEAMAVALELLGKPASLDTLREARRRATAEAQRSRLAAHEVWLRVKFSLPDDTTGLAAARALADSLLADASRASGTFTESLAALAVLTGRAHLAASLARRAGAELYADDALPARAIPDARALLAYAAAGTGADSIRMLERRVTTDVRSMVAPAEQDSTLREILQQAPALAYSVRPLENHRVLSENQSHLVRAQSAHASGDPARARRLIDSAGVLRARRRAADRTLDFTFAYASLLAALGDPPAAIAWLQPVLEASQRYSSESISRFPNTGGLMRGLALRADLAIATGDTAAARRWARPVAILWRNADPALQPVVRRMTALAATPAPARGR